jgi:hypothetical protein
MTVSVFMGYCCVKAMLIVFFGPHSDNLKDNPEPWGF